MGRPSKPGRWIKRETRHLQDCRVFQVQEVHFEPPGGLRPPQAFYVVDAPDWVNVIPLTPEGKVLMVRQYRFGIEEFTLEIPGGMCDPGEDPPVTAARELREETGYAAARMIPLGWVHPNPAIQSNRCFTYLAEDTVRVGDAQPDGNEAFEWVEEPLDRIDALIGEARITHALVVGAFQLLRSWQRAEAESR